MRSHNPRSSRRRTNSDQRVGSAEAVEPRMLLSAIPVVAPVNRDAPVNEGIVNGSFEANPGERGSEITHDVDGWFGVRAQTVNQEIGVDPDQLPSSDGIELWQNIGKKTYDGQNQIELDGRGNVVDGVYQKFSTDVPTNLMFAAYARRAGSSDIEVYIDGAYVETVTPPTANGRHDIRQAYFYEIEAGDHSILFKEVTGQNNGSGAVIDNVRLVSDHMKAHLDSAGRHTHNFFEHVSRLYGTDLMAPGQTEYDAKGFEKVSDTLYRGNSPITGLRPVIEEAIDREIARNPRLEGEALEAKIANRLTNLNDFEKLQTVTQDKLIEMTGIDFRAMTKAEREATINHLLHSPIPFGNIDEVLTPDTRIDLGYTHTLDTNWTRVGDLGDGVWKVWIISNNNNGSHTGHNLGEFKVQLSPGLTPAEAKAAANAMIVNTNNNNRLSLDEAAKDILYGVTPRLDPVNRDAPVNEGIVNGSFESYTSPRRRAITHDVDGWYGVRAQTVNREIGVDPDTLPDSYGIEVWRNSGKKTYDGQIQIELDGRGNVVDGVYQKFSTDVPTNLMFAAYARKAGSSDIEVYIDGEYVETVTPPTANGRHDIRQAYFYEVEAGEHSILFKEVTGQNNSVGAVIDNVRLVSDHMKSHLDSAGRHTHNFFEHVSRLYGTDLMAPGQTEYDAKGFEKVSDTLYRGNSPITGLRPVIEEAIDREIARNPRLEGEALEAKIANRLTNLNDFEKLQTVTQDKLIEMTGIDFRAMTKAEREATINHLLHSPIPFGNIDEVLTPDTRIDLGYTHTLDRNWTRVGDLGDGLWKVWIISNNNNGSHTGHNLGEFKVQLAPGLTPAEAKAAANAMIVNTNNNNRLRLDEAAKDILYGVTPRLDPGEPGRSGQ